MENYEWIASREKDNFSYTRGENPLFGQDCNNCLIISDSENGFVRGIGNHAIIKNRKRTRVIPIDDSEKILNLSNKIIHGRIYYKKPTAIRERENLPNLTMEEIKRNVLKDYGIEILRLAEIENEKGRNKIYKFGSNEGFPFILKYRGKNPELFESKASLLKKISYFPKIKLTLSGNHHTSFGENIYSVEEFLGGERLPRDKDSYFELIGKNLALLHNEINLKKDKSLENILMTGTSFLSKSNLISMKIDLFQTGEDGFFTDDVESLKGDLASELNKLPNQIIHGDLNRSNLIWTENSVKMIDSENMKLSKRINEFIPPLIFKGNLEVPEYIQNSVSKLLTFYNNFSENTIEESEKSLLPGLLKASLIKLYVVYNIRRNRISSEYRDKIISNLEIFGEEFE